MVPNLPPKEEWMPEKITIENCMKELRRKSEMPKDESKKCTLRTLPELRVLEFQPGGERLIVKRWQRGYALTRPRMQVNHSFVPTATDGLETTASHGALEQDG